MQRLALAACVLVCLCNLGASINLVSTPDKIQPGITTSLKLRCEATSSTQVKLILSIALNFTPSQASGTAGNSTSQPGRQTLATVVPGSQIKNPNFNGTVTEGKIDGQSLNAVLEITTTDLTPGKYACVVTGYSPTFTPATETADVDVMRKQSLSPDQLSKDLNVKLQNMEKEVNSLKQRWSAIDSNAIFHKTPTSHKGSKYLLSKTRQQNVNLCQFMCTVHGGYLAEVDDEAEMNFLRDFIRPLLVNDNEYPDVFIGATDHGHKGVFKFMQNENKPVYTNWGGFPSNGYDCLILAKNSDYLMNDYDCNEATRFLCEIPN